MAVTQGVSADGPIARHEQSVIDRIADFNDPHQEWRRLFSELFGTFLLVLVAAGGGMMGHAFPGVITRTDAVVGPLLMVMGVTLSSGRR
jgi:aquaporin Z